MNNSEQARIKNLFLTVFPERGTATKIEELPNGKIRAIYINDLSGARILDYSIVETLSVLANRWDEPKWTVSDIIETTLKNIEEMAEDNSDEEEVEDCPFFCC